MNQVCELHFHLFSSKHLYLPLSSFSLSFLLVVNPDNSFEVLVDQAVVNSGNLLTDMTPPINPAAEIEDPDDHKPEDWDERPKIQDPDAVKPEDW